MVIKIVGLVDYAIQRLIRMKRPKIVGVAGDRLAKR
jgi:hypothetical protein